MAAASSDGAVPSTSPVGHPPRITVVVVAHARRKYLAGALRSIEGQTLPRSDFDVILLTDFEDPELAPEVARLRPSRVSMSPGPLGTWVDMIRGRIRSDLVAFLDDDDRFEPDKLARALEAFQAHAGANYLHHRVRPVGPEEGGGPPGPGAGPRVSPIREVGPPEWRARFDLLWDQDAAFNLSSIVVRREVLEAFPELLARVRVSLSTFLFFAALRLDGTVLLDPEALTRYRREEGVGRSGAASPRSARRISELAAPRADDARTLLQLVAPLHLRLAEAPMRAAIARGTLVAALEGGGTSRRNIAGAVWDFWRFRPVGAVVAERPVLFDALLYLVSPTRARAAWACRIATAAAGSTLV